MIIKRLLVTLRIFILIIFFVLPTVSIALSLQNNIDKAKAIKIAKADAKKAYREINVYEVEIRENKKYWLIDFVLKNKGLNGGGPHYVISKKNGMILKRVYEQ